MVRKSQLLLPAAIALATGNVSKTFPELAADRGLLEKGKRADVVIVENHNLGRVRHVVANGELVVFNAAMGVGDLRVRHGCGPLAGRWTPTSAPLTACSIGCRQPRAEAMPVIASVSSADEDSCQHRLDTCPSLKTQMPQKWV